MATQKTQRYMEMQMKELKASIADEDASTPKKVANNQGKNAEIAKLYEDAAEYEKDIEGFEEELEILKASKLKDFPASLTQELPSEERDYQKELQAILKASWKHRVEVENTHPVEQLSFIEKTEFSQLLEKFNTAFPDYEANFEMEARDIFTKRLEMLIAIKKEHLKEEISEIKISGLKPSYAKRIYKQYHGIK